MKWYKIDLDEYAPDIVKPIVVGGKKLCLVKDGGELFVLQHTCPHAGALLSGGWCKHGNLVCPVHRYEYNLRTGRGAAGQGDYVDTYPVEKRDDGYYVGLKEGWISKLFS